MYLEVLSKKLIRNLNLPCKHLCNYIKCKYTSISNMTAFVDKQLNLIEIEHLAEIEENNLETAHLSLKILQRKGICIPKLIINSLETGLYNRSIATFSLRTTQKTFTFNILSTGDIVKLNHSEEGSDPTGDECNGIVTKVSDQHIAVAFDSLAFRDTLDSLNQHGNSVALIKVANKVTYERLKQAMKDLSSYSNGPAHHLIEVLFGDSDPGSNRPQEVSYLNDQLNECQRNAVSFALSQRELAIIHGPPGTGKTTTMIEIIAQLVTSGLKVLACAPSNVAVDNLLEKLSSLKILNSGHGFNSKSFARRMKLVRLGHPARILDPKLQELSLDALISRSGDAAIIRDVRGDIERIQGKLRRCYDNGQKRSLRQERKSLYAELRKREKKAIKDVVAPADVVLATNVGAYPRGPLQNLPRDHFDVVVIDECGQALEASCWIPLLRSRKCILAGDHLQLSPTIVSNEAAAEGLCLTLLERLIKLHGDKVVCMLTEQYRMNHVIMDWASKQMYDDRLTAHTSVKTHLLSDLPGIASNENTNASMLLIDTVGCEMNEAESEESDSKANEGEAQIVYQHVASLVESGLKQEDIAVISPYSLQVDIIRHLFHDKYRKIEVKSVDGFQGREKEAVVLSLVRSNVENEIGFLSDNRRLNVAVTRARRHLTVVCDSGTVSEHDFIKSLVDHITEQGEVRSGFEYMHNDQLEATGAFDSLDSFHLIAPKLQVPSNKGKTTKGTSAKTSNKRNKAKADTKSRDKPVPTPIDPELKNLFRTIILKYQKQFLPFFAQTSLTLDTSSRAPDLSEALDVEVIKNEKKIIFSESLTSSERKVIHEVCDELGIDHVSVGEGESRKAIVSFLPKSTPMVKNTQDNPPASPNHASATDPILQPSPQEPDDDVVEVDVGNAVQQLDVQHPTDVEASNHVQEGFTYTATPLKDSNITPSNSLASNEEEEIDSLFVICEKCGKRLPKENLELHLAHCERIMKLKMRTEENKVPLKVKSTKQNKAKHGSKKQRNKKSSNSNTTDEDFDSLINEAMTSNRSCFHSNCSESVTTTGQLCNNCKKTFCLYHCIPEVHGCTARARVNAQRQISRDGILYAGSGVPNRKPPPEKRALMKNKLSSKLKTFEEARKTTDKEKK